MTFREYEKVRVKKNGTTGTIVDIEVRDGKTFYCVEYDDEFRHFDEEMGIIYCTKDELEKV